MLIEVGAADGVSVDVGTALLVTATIVGDDGVVLALGSGSRYCCTLYGIIARVPSCR